MSIIPKKFVNIEFRNLEGNVRKYSMCSGLVQSDESTIFYYRGVRKVIFSKDGLVKVISA